MKDERPPCIEVEIPPIISFTKEFAFIKAYTQPIYKIFDNNTSSVESIVKETRRIMDIKVCINNKDKKLLNHDLKIKEVLLWHNEIIAKGERRINTRIIIYLSEYVNIRLKKLIEIILFKTPSKENRSIEDVKDKSVLIFITNVEKSILHEKIVSPTERID